MRQAAALALRALTHEPLCQSRHGAATDSSRWRQVEFISDNPTYTTMDELEALLDVELAKMGYFPVAEEDWEWPDEDHLVIKEVALDEDREIKS